MNATHWICVSLLVALVLSGCEKATRPSSGPDAMVARVNDRILTMGDMTVEIQTAMLPVATSQMKQEWTQKWIQSELLYQEALRLELDRDRKTARELQRMQRDYLANILLERVLSQDSLTVTDAEIALYYEEQKEEFIRQEPELRLSVIVLQNENAAREVWRSLVRGRADFDEMARTRSEDVASAQQGGDLGFLKRGDISDAGFRDLVFSMGVGKLSRPVSTESGYCIIQVTDSHEVGSVRDLDKVKGEIMNRVLEDRRRNMIKQLVDGLRQKAEVEVNRFLLIQKIDQELMTETESLKTE